jgi:hypothetical protein
LVSGVLAAPMAEFVGLSSRAGLTLTEAATFSLPPVYLLGLVIPDLGGFHEWMTYAGVVPLLLAPLGVTRRTLFWLGAAGLAAMIALGTNLALFPLLFGALPGFGLLRVPPRAWFVVALAVCALAGHGAQRLTEAALPRLRQRYGTRGARLLEGRAWLAALVALCALDLARVNGTLTEARPRPALPEAAAWLRAQPGQFRVYSPSYSLPPGDGLEHVDGVNPLQLARAGEFIAAASGVPRAGYSVTAPPFATGDLATDNAGYTPVAELLGRLNVRFVAAEFPLEAEGLRLRATFGGTRVYANEAARPRAWMEGGGEAEVTAWSPNRITLAATGPGRLVLSEMAYPGWRARVDGDEAAVQAEGVLRAVDVGAGAHRVEFEYRPASVYVGAALTALGLLLAAWLGLRARAAGEW